MGLNVGTFLVEATAKSPEKIAVIDGDIRLTYAELDREARRFAAILEHLGIRPGDKVAISLPNSRYFVICYYGILYHGCTVVPLNNLLSPEEVLFQVDQSDSVLLVAFDEKAAVLSSEPRIAASCQRLLAIDTGELPIPGGWMSYQELAGRVDGCILQVADTDPNDTAVIIYTSGTTGRPKGAELTHFNLFSNAVIPAVDIFEICPEDSGLCVLPLFHSFGQTCLMNQMIYQQVRIEVMPRFEAAEALAAIEKNRHTIFMGVPTMYYFMLDVLKEKGGDLSSLRLCFSGGASMPIEVTREFKENHGLEILEGYGLSETSPVACGTKCSIEQKEGSIGVPLWGVEMKIVDKEDNVLPPGERGEIVIRGHNVMKGYYKNPEATSDCMRNGWFHSGDIGYMDEEGYFFVVDRTKDVIIRGGYNVYPREVEEVIFQYPGVSEAAVIGVSDKAYGEEVMAYVAMRSGHTATSSAIIDHCKAHLAGFKYPRRIDFLETLPKGATGKILKRELRSIAREVASG